MDRQVTAILATNKVGLIGINNDLPWKLPKDMARFKRFTTGATVIMGRKTFESMGSRPLPNRENIIVSNNMIEFAPDLSNSATIEPANFISANSVGTALSYASRPNIFIIGGATIYEAAAKHCDRVILTLVDSCAGFPEPYHTYLTKEFQRMLVCDFVTTCLTENVMDGPNKDIPTEYYAMARRTTPILSILEDLGDLGEREV